MPEVLDSKVKICNCDRSCVIDQWRLDHEPHVTFQEVYFLSIADLAIGCRILLLEFSDVVIHPEWDPHVRFFHMELILDKQPKN